jgi:hypothetical protein
MTGGVMTSLGAVLYAYGFYSLNKAKKSTGCQPG